jgi:hypothetical protein
MSGVIGPLTEGAEVSDDGGIANDESRILMPRFTTPFTLMYKCLKNARKLPLCATFRDVRRAVGKEVSLRKPFRSQQIGTEMSPYERSKDLLA